MTACWGLSDLQGFELPSGLWWARLSRVHSLLSVVCHQLVLAGSECLLACAGASPAAYAQDSLLVEALTLPKAGTPGTEVLVSATWLLAA